METLIFGLLLFIAVHMISVIPGLRAKLVARLGEGPYKGLFSLISLLGLYFIISGKSQSPLIFVWETPAWSHWASSAAMLVSVILLAAAYLPTNLRKITAHPMLWGVIVWSGAHLLSNGNLAAVTLFGGFGLFAIISIITARRQNAEAGNAISHHWSKDATVVTLGTLIFAIIVYFHINLFGKPVLL